ncbi:MAG: cbb3-type cytochrome c oxidase subunit 3 [Pseudomonadota bacterium]
MDYETLRQAADSWGLVYLTALFLTILAFTFRPGTKKLADRNAQIPLREDDDNGPE